MYFLDWMRWRKLEMILENVLTKTKTFWLIYPSFCFFFVFFTFSSFFFTEEGRWDHPEQCVQALTTLCGCLSSYQTQRSGQQWDGDEHKCTTFVQHKCMKSSNEVKVENHLTHMIYVLWLLPVHHYPQFPWSRPCVTTCWRIEGFKWSHRNTPIHSHTLSFPTKSHLGSLLRSDTSTVTFSCCCFVFKYE